MTKRIFAAIVVASMFGCQGKGGGGGGSSHVDLKTDDQKTLYALGLMLGRNIQAFNLKPDELDLVKAGMADSVNGVKPQVELSQFGPKVNELHRSRQTAAAETEKKKGEEYAAKAAQEKGAIKTESGMVFIPITGGTGESPKATDTVKVHYHGTLTNGEVFDSSRERGQPAEFPLNRVIPCWTEGVQKLKVGGKAKLVCPSKIAYGDAGRPPKIPGGATLVFEVELLEIKPPPAAPQGLSMPGQPPQVGGPPKVVMPTKAAAAKPAEKK